MDFTEELKRKTETVNKWIFKLAPKTEPKGYHSRIFDAANYSLSAGGKRIRPILSLTVCEMLGGEEKVVMPFACAIEYIHTYSLIHDDLPCMDNDDMRRGKPTCHVRYDEPLALLAGDGLLNYAFEIISNSGAPSELIVQAMGIISKSSGMNGMIGGQVLDMKGADSYDELIELYRMKTGAIITAAAKIGVLSSGVNDAKIYNAITSYTDNVGIAFQIKDDILDLEGDEKLLGKRVGHDEATGKKTFVNSLGIDGAKLALEEYTANAKSALSIFGDKAEFLLEMADYLLLRNH